MMLSLSSSPHLKRQRNTGQVMRLVMYAAIPGLIAQTWFFGFGALVHFAVAAATCIATEALIVELRKRDVERTIKDSSALLTALLLAVSIPPYAPWWLTVIGSVFAIAIVKQLYGGLGNNPFNPAMAAYVMLLISFPVQMTNWAPVASLSQYEESALDSASIVFTGYNVEGYSIEQLRSDVDGHTMATPLDHLKTALTTGETSEEALQAPIYSNGLGQGWFWINMAYLFGGLLLLRLKVINWHIPVGVIVGTFAISGFFHLIDGSVYASPLFHLFSGGLMFGAFFIATDPVSASTTDKGRLLFGAGIGLWIYIIRTWGGYPDAVAFAVLIMNMGVPLIDYYTRPRTYGHRSEHKSAIKRAEDRD
ncbi:electron transport complex subunit RsxD [Aestuariibacter sp. AA17]|uniref:Ion-translocating oxidoreductase complex subunit D n=1 Tax=Fluctibacter corallii TaxID=2984329 RepID=A0ABT3AAB8_9ALTE|nr:electron transport complex subunit RsxD [Aestuariibacter sp. AA17]MCV2885623.1 electron transport complex subunit RsxD [Aestuariibacter sp. AA17]